MYLEKFTLSIHNKKLILLKFSSKEDNEILVRKCAPMDYGPSKRAKNKDNRYHLWDYESDTRNHVLSLLPDQIEDMVFLDDLFDPSDFITWKCDWFIVRDWGIHS